jgi:hypothetical protein
LAGRVTVAVRFIPQDALPIRPASRIGNGAAEFGFARRLSVREVEGGADDEQRGVDYRGPSDLPPRSNGRQ